MNTLPTIAKLPGAAGELETFAMANCLMILSSQRNTAAASSSASVDEEIGRSYPCKTCGRKFTSFQALGGHRASHKKIKLAGDEVANVPTMKAKVHACSICGVEFPIGQALGGHMRRHRGGVGGGDGSAVVSSVTTEGSSGTSDCNNNNNNNNNNNKRKMNNDGGDDVVVVPVLKKSSNSKRVCLDLIDLNLTLWKNEDVNNSDDNVHDHHDDLDLDIEEGEIVEQSVQDNEDDDDFLKLELRCRR